MKSKLFISSLVLLFFALLGGGSFSEEDISLFFTIILIAVVVTIVGAIISAIVQNNNKNKRLQMITEDEQSSTEFDRSVFIGNDRCRLYFDASKKKVMIARVMTEGIKKEYIDDFEFSGKSLASYTEPIFNVYDSSNRKFLTGTYSDSNIVYEVALIAERDANKDASIRNTIQPILKTLNTSLGTLGILIDEGHGLIAISNLGKVKHIFNYIKASYLSKKQGDKSTITTKSIGNYLFIMDEFFKVLVIIGSGYEGYRVFNYSDILDVSYEENGSLIYTKSTSRTIGGAIVGGALMGGAGAVVGGLSGASQQNKEIKSMDIKILLRNTNDTSKILHFNDANRVLKTKEEEDRKLYSSYLNNANREKDILSVIIDNTRQTNIPHIQSTTAPATSSVADELTKLAKLKSDGVLTEEEFLAQKSKLLGL